MMRNNKGFFIILFCFVITVLSAGEYEYYIQTFPWVGEEGEEPEVVFAELIAKDKLVAVMFENSLFYYNSYEWVNEIGKIRNDCEYKIKVRKDIAPIKKAYTQLTLKPGTTHWLYYIGDDGLIIRNVFRDKADKIVSIKSRQSKFQESQDLDMPLLYGKVYGITVMQDVTINWKINE